MLMAALLHSDHGGTILLCGTPRLSQVERSFSNTKIKSMANKNIWVIHNNRYDLIS